MAAVWLRNAVAALVLSLLTLFGGHAESGSHATCAEEHLTEMVELHFQEGFSGEEIRVLIDGQETRRLVANTRLQLGLAEVIEMEIVAERAITLVVESLGLEETISPDQHAPFITVNLVEGQFVIQFTEDAPGYL